MRNSFGYKLQLRVGSQKGTLKHGEACVGFEEAATVFMDPMALTIYDPDHSEDEERWITMGISKNSRLLIVCHNFHEESREVVKVRMYSSRKANKREISEYGEQS